MRHAIAPTSNARTVRRCLAQIRRTLQFTGGDPSAGSVEVSQLLTAARRLAFLVLCETSNLSTGRAESLEQALKASRAEGSDRFYSHVVIPRCAELLGESELHYSPLPDAILDALLKTFRVWSWSAVERGRADRVGPELLGVLCELAQDQKAHGAYFTSPDVTRYVCEKVILPALLDRSRPTAGRDTVGEILSGWKLPESVDRYSPLHCSRYGQFATEATYERSARLAQLDRCRSAWCAGQIRTPDDWVTWNLDLALLIRDWAQQTIDSAALSRFHGSLEDIQVLDPTCGSGDFLMAVLETLLPLRHVCRKRLSQLGEARGRSPFPPVEMDVAADILRRNLFGVDQAADAVETCRMRLLLRVAAAGERVLNLNAIQFKLKQSDVLLDEVFPEVMDRHGGFDAVVGNPPYVAYQRGGKYVAGGYLTEGTENLYALVSERATRLLKRGGRLGVILPVSSTSLSGFRPLADLLQRGNTWISSYSNRPGKLFPGVEQRLSIWITGPSRTPVTYASAYQHWYAEERPRLFSRLTFVPASKWAGTGLPIKSGCKQAEGLFGKIAAHAGVLGTYERPELDARSGTAAVWLHDGPTYWVRALTSPPAADISLGAGHYHRIPVAGGAQAAVLAAVLCSTTFYFFFKMVSNCRDLGRKDWAAFPLDPLPGTRELELVSLGSQLQERLQESAQVRSRRYPSGTVEYREYYPSLAKTTLDNIDRVLAGHYGFSHDELDYLLTYDLKYRMGQNDAG